VVQQGGFILKGATLFTLWTGHPHRATRDVDLLGVGDPSEGRIRDIFGEVIGLELADDGVEFDAGSRAVGPIREDQEYGGVRVEMVARVTAARVRLQIDVGFGDAVTPPPVRMDLPVLLDFPIPRLLVYPRETVVAEKLDAIVQLGTANSRMKDFYRPDEESLLPEHRHARRGKTGLVLDRDTVDLDGDALASSVRCTNLLECNRLYECLSFGDHAALSRAELVASRCRYGRRPLLRLRC
jgi:hypothetical protein